MSKKRWRNPKLTFLPLALRIKFTSACSKKKSPINIRYIWQNTSIKIIKFIFVHMRFYKWGQLNEGLPSRSETRHLIGRLRDTKFEWRERQILLTTHCGRNFILISVHNVLCYLGFVQQLIIARGSKCGKWNISIIRWRMHGGKTCFLLSTILTLNQLSNCVSLKLKAYLDIEIIKLFSLLVLDLSVGILLLVTKFFGKY